MNLDEETGPERPTTHMHTHTITLTGGLSIKTSLLLTSILL